MIYYAIPLRAKSTSKNWDNDVQNLVRTLKSISNNLHHKVIIACHEIPKIPTINRLNVEFIQVKYGAPENIDNYMADKNSKKKQARLKIMEEAKEGDLFMYLDADDLLHKDFYNHVQDIYKSHPQIRDIVFYAGYMYDYARKKIAYLNGHNRIFYRNCGSCFVSKLRAADISKEDNSYLATLIDHTEYPYIGLRFGRGIYCSYLPLVCYLVNHGSNDRDIRGIQSSLNTVVDQSLCDDWVLLDSFTRNFTLS